MNDFRVKDGQFRAVRVPALGKSYIPRVLDNWFEDCAIDGVHFDGVSICLDTVDGCIALEEGQWIVLSESGDLFIVSHGIFELLFEPGLARSLDSQKSMAELDAERERVLTREITRQELADLNASNGFQLYRYSHELIWLARGYEPAHPRPVLDVFLNQMVEQSKAKQEKERAQLEQNAHVRRLTCTRKHNPKNPE